MSLATGVGEIAGATLAIGDLTLGSTALGAISFGTGAVGAGLDAKDCLGGRDNAACVGFGLSLPGVIAGGADMLLPEGLLSEGVSSGLDYVGLGTGAFGYGWDLARTFWPGGCG